MYPNPFAQGNSQGQRVVTIIIRERKFLRKIFQKNGRLEFSIVALRFLVSGTLTLSCMARRTFEELQLREMSGKRTMNM